MITDSIINLFKSIMTGVMSILPTWTPIDLSGYVTQLSYEGAPGCTHCANAINGGIFHWLSWANWYLPMSEAVVLLQLILGMLGTLLTIRATLWLLRAFHVIGGSDD